MKFTNTLCAAIALTAAMPVAAQDLPAAAPVERKMAEKPPKLVVMVSVDQLSADLFTEYRREFQFGFARMLSGGVFPSGYQSHAATETCPGHSTILSGARPSRSGIIANEWTDFSIPRANKDMNCAEDPTQVSTIPGRYVATDKNLKVSTLGEWMKQKDPNSRVVSVAGKDRSAIMMGGHKVDELWWFQGGQFISFNGRPMHPTVAKMNERVTARIATPQPAMQLPEFCKPRLHRYQFSPNRPLGDGLFAREAGDVSAYQTSPEYDEGVLALAAALATDMKLGQGPSTDLLIVGASASDYVGHRLGTRGSEMCLQLLSLDKYLGQLFAVLDKSGIDYVVGLTADHGGIDMPERSNELGHLGAERVEVALTTKSMSDAIATKLGLTGNLLHGGTFGDIYIDTSLNAKQRAAVQAEAVARYKAHRQIRHVFTKEEILATPQPKGPADSWTTLEQVRASYYPGRSGDLYTVLQPRVTPIATNTGGSVATHGSAWNYDRRVPILFWRKNITPFEQPLAIETVDIAPTLAAIAEVPVPVEIDGRCLDIQVGPGNTCK